MSRDAVKFGRMSKKQREKVEDEVRFHRAQLRAQTETAPDSSVFDTQTPSSSDQLQTPYNGSYGYASELGYGVVGSAGGGGSAGYGGYGSTAVSAAAAAAAAAAASGAAVHMGYDISADYVDSTTAYDPRPSGQPVDAMGGPHAADSALMASVATTGGGKSLGALVGGGGGGGSSGLVAVKQEATMGSSGTTSAFVDSTTFLPSPPSNSASQQQQQQQQVVHQAQQQQQHQHQQQPQQQQQQPQQQQQQPSSAHGHRESADLPPSVHPNPIQITELLTKTISDAHTRTCLYPVDHIHEMFQKQQELTKILYYKNLAHEELWLECAQKLTTVIQQIIEFAKMVPGFMKLSQDDQIVLLKAGSFELAILRMSRYLDTTRNTVLYSDTLLSPDAFFTTDNAETKLVNCIFDVAKSIAELKLTETELALYSACVLLQADRPGLKGLGEISRLGHAVLRALKLELDRNHVGPIKGDVTVCDAMLAKLPNLRELSMLHMDALAKFKRSTPHLEFPALHKELFSVDS